MGHNPTPAISQHLLTTLPYPAVSSAAARKHAIKHAIKHANAFNVLCFGHVLSSAPVRSKWTVLH
jgi:hypothetical protein